MVIYIGADHGGFALKEKLKQIMKAAGYDLTDLGAATQVEDDDYPDFARRGRGARECGRRPRAAAS